MCLICTLHCDSITSVHLQGALNTRSIALFALLGVCPLLVSVVSGENMASHTGKAFLCFGRINVKRVGLQEPVNRVTYATAFSTRHNEGELKQLTLIQNQCFKLS